METRPAVNGETNMSDADLSTMSNEIAMEANQEQTARKKEEPSKNVSQSDISPSLKTISKTSPAKPDEHASDESTSKKDDACGDTETTSNSTTIIVLSEDDGKQNPQRRMSLRPRSIPKKYTDTSMCGEDDNKDPLGNSDPLEISPIKNSSPPIQKSSVTVTTIKSPVKSVKPTKVMRPPPELIKAPVSKFPISSSTSVTVVPRTKANTPNSDTAVLVDSPSILKMKTGPVVSSLSPSVTVSAISSSKPVTKPVSLPASSTPVRKTTTTTGNGSIKPNDPFESLGLSDDSYIVEAPSFVVPYLIEKRSEEDIKNLLERLKPPDMKDTKGHQSSDEDSSDSEGKGDNARSSAEKSKREDISSMSEKTNKPTEANRRAKEDDDYFNGAIGHFFLDIGLSLVQEHVQGDLLRVQKRKVSKGSKISDPSLSVNALSKGLEITKAKNEPYRLPVTTCDRCNFKSESKLVMANHWSSPLVQGSGSNLRYTCHWCTFESKDSLLAVKHIDEDHELKSLVMPELMPHQCPLCQFEDVTKSKVTRHTMSCQKRFIAERNLEPPLDWEPPAKIPRMRGLRAYPGLANTPGLPLNSKGLHLPYHPLLPVSAHSTLFGGAQSAMQAKAAKPAPAPQLPGFPKLQSDAVGSILPRSFAGMGLNPALLSKANFRHNSNQASPYAPFTVPSNQVYQTIAKSFQTFQGQVSSSAVPNSGGKHHPPANISATDKVKKSSAINPVSMLSSVINTSGLTIQSAPSSTSNKVRPNQQPSISITPLPRATQAVAANKHTLQSNPVIPVGNSVAPVVKNPPPASKPAQSGSTPNKGVVCEICDNSIKDLEQLRHHMQWIHKVKIHPKMIHNRPPLNCQKCQCRFFTDQGLERHLLGSHGLVTSSMQEAANRGQDGGRCPICGKIHQWKLLSHVVKDHGLSLKPAHLSYKCTVCTATFTMYKLFENHVYTAHSVVARKVLDKEKTENKRGSTSTSNTSSSGVLRINDEITIIPQTARHELPDQSVSRVSKGEKRSRVDIIDLSDDEDHDGLSLPKSQVTITKVPAPKPSLTKASKDSSSKRLKQDNPLE